MKVRSGRVVDGKVVVEGDPLVEGAIVTVVIDEDRETFELSPEEEADLRASIAQADRGEFIEAEDLLRQLRRAT